MDGEVGQLQQEEEERRVDLLEGWGRSLNGQERGRGGLCEWRRCRRGEGWREALLEGEMGEERRAGGIQKL